MSEQTAAEAVQDSFPGETFARAREQLGLSIERVAGQLHLPERMIRAIEQGALDQLTDPVFARGYIRAYARFLKLDADALVATYNRLTGNLTTTGQVRAIGSLSTVPGRRHGHPLLKIGTWLFVLILIAVSLWWWQTQYGFDAEERVALEDLPVSVETSDGTTLVLPQPGEPAEPLLEPLEPASAPLAAMAEQAAVMTEADEPGEPISASAPAADEAATAAAAEPAQAEAVAFPGLAIEFNDDCWLSVKDASGRSLFNGVAGAGRSLELTGVEPLAVVVGRVSAVTAFRYAGTVIDLAPHSKDNVARLTLPR